MGLTCYFALDWSGRQAEIGGLALSTTSLAVVYAVLVETGLNRELVGKRLMSATFVTDIATVVGLTVLFVKPTVWILPFALVSVAMIVGLPKLSPWFFARFGDRVIEPEIKLVFACLFCLMWLGSRANSQAALPAFVLGLVMSSHYVQHRQEQDRMRVVAFAFLTPFFFLKGGRTSRQAPSGQTSACSRCCSSRRWGRSSPASTRLHAAIRRRTRPSRRS